MFVFHNLAHEYVSQLVRYIFAYRRRLFACAVSRSGASLVSVSVGTGRQRIKQDGERDAKCFVRS